MKSLTVLIIAWNILNHSNLFHFWHSFPSKRWFCFNKGEFMSENDQVKNWNISVEIKFPAFIHKPLGKLIKITEYCAGKRGYSWWMEKFIELRISFLVQFIFYSMTNQPVELKLTSRMMDFGQKSNNFMNKVTDLSYKFIQTR